ncbi:alpha-L-fucosidase [Nocardiaceae bacterium NPDC056970]
MFDATWESVSGRALPGWYDDVKLGIFVHWGLYSVPAWAPQVDDIQQLLRERGPRGMLRDNPYAEWYLNTMRIEGSPTRRHHEQTYGIDCPYDNFVEQFDRESSAADLDALASLCAQTGAGYVVLTTKHHDGFTLWPSDLVHPRKGAYHAKRDLVGDLTDAVGAQGMRMGLYYSGGYDWPYNDALMESPADLALAVPPGDDYREYATAHVRELIDRYGPSVLWNDICWPPGGNLAGLFAYYYNTVDDGVVNDRWAEQDVKRDMVSESLLRGAGALAQRFWRFVPDDKKELAFPGSAHYDFRTPEYAQFDTVVDEKWESTRGVGHSFAANRNERPEDIVSATELIRSFVDIVSKNGNLLIGIGPAADGTVPEEQQAPLRGLGEWMAVNRDAVIGSRPWTTAAGTTSEGTQVRYTRKGPDVFVFLLDLPGTRRFTLRGVDLRDVGGVELLGAPTALTFSAIDGELCVELPAQVAVSATHVLRLAGAAG